MKIQKNKIVHAVGGKLIKTPQKDKGVLGAGKVKSQCSSAGGSSTRKTIQVCKNGVDKKNVKVSTPRIMNVDKQLSKGLEKSI